MAILFQIALGVGMPWGHLAMGGKFPGRLPVFLRVASVIQSALLVFIGLIILTRAAFILPEWYAASRGWIWAVVAFCTASAALNLATPSRRERILWAPVAVILLLCNVIIAVS